MGFGHGMGTNARQIRAIVSPFIRNYGPRFEDLAGPIMYAIANPDHTVLPASAKWLRRLPSAELLCFWDDLSTEVRRAGVSRVEHVVATWVAHSLCHVAGPLGSSRQGRGSADVTSGTPARSDAPHLVSAAKGTPTLKDKMALRRAAYWSTIRDDLQLWLGLSAVELAAALKLSKCGIEYVEDPTNKDRPPEVTRLVNLHGVVASLVMHKGVGDARIWLAGAGRRFLAIGMESLEGEISALIYRGKRSVDAVPFSREHDEDGGEDTPEPPRATHS